MYVQYMYIYIYIYIYICIHIYANEHGNNSVFMEPLRPILWSRFPGTFLAPPIDLYWLNRLAWNVYLTQLNAAGYQVHFVSG